MISSELKKINPVSPDALEFQDVMARFFPLLADIQKLQAFVDTYLNTEDSGDRFYFKVSMPIVHMEMITYGKMYGPDKKSVYTSQQELLFMIPIEWYEKHEGGRFSFNKKAYRKYKYGRAGVTPFIFVDNPLSVLGGREIFGWPKSLMTVMPQVNNWSLDPTEDSNLATIGAMRIKELFSDEKPRFRKIVEIDREAPMSFSLSGASNWMSKPVTRYLEQLNFLWETGFQSYEQLLRLVTEWWAQSGAREDTENLPELLRALSSDDLGLPGVASMLADPLNALSGHVSNSIGLKQFRDSDEPDKACYMAIANSRAKLTSVHGFGSLGSFESNVTSLSGGYTIKLHRYPGHPIIETLGLQVWDNYEDEKEGVQVAVLKPIMPFWASMNFQYVGAEPMIMEAAHHVRVNSEVDHLPWLQNEYTDFKKTVQPVRPAEPPLGFDIPVKNPFYNEATGLGDDTLKGPYSFKGSLRIFGLEVVTQTRLEFLRQYLADKVSAAGIEIKDSTDNLVYMVVTDFGDLKGGEKAGVFSNRSLHFHVPVTLSVKGGEDQVGSIQVFSFGSNMLTVITSVEVRGPAMQHVLMDSPNDIWIEDLHLDAPVREVFSLETQVAPRYGHEVQREKLISIVNKSESEQLKTFDLEYQKKVDAAKNLFRQFSVDDFSNVKELPGLVKALDIDDLVAPLLNQFHREVENAGSTREGVNQILDYLVKKSDLKVLADIRTAANKLLDTQNDPLENFSRVFALKQFPNEQNPDKACYQSLVRIDHVIKNIESFKGTDERGSGDSVLSTITSNSRIHIYKHKFHPIQQQLGLVPIESESKGDHFSFQPKSYHCIEGSFGEKVGKTLCYRTMITKEADGWLERTDKSAPNQQ